MSFQNPPPPYSSSGSYHGMPMPNVASSFPSANTPGYAGTSNYTSGSGTAGTSSGIQLTRDAQALIQTYLPSPTGPDLLSTDEERRMFLPDEKERLRDLYEKQDRLRLHEPSSSYATQGGASFPGPVHFGEGHALPLPLCIPQISVSARFDSAFARGYNEVLQRVGISDKMLLDFVDGLNLAIVSSPPLRVVDVAGSIIGFVPFHWAMIASIVMQTTAQTGMHVLSKTLTDRYLRAANLRLFKPRGLSVRLCTTPAMLALLQGETAKSKSKLDKFGRAVGTVLLHAPIPFSSRIVRAIADKPPVITPAPGESTENVVLRRRLALVSPPGPELALPLRLEGLPPPAKPEGIMGMINEWGLKLDERKELKKEGVNEQRRRALQRIDEAFATQGGATSYGRGHGPGLGPRPSMTSGPYGAQMSSGSFDMRVIGEGLNDRRQTRQMRKEQREVRKEVKARRKAERRAAKRERKNERRARRGKLPRAARGPKETRMQRRVANADLLEHWSNDKLLWIVIMSAEADRDIEGIELAERLEDEEHVRPEVWRAEMELEKEQFDLEKEDLEYDSDSDSSSSSDSDEENYKRNHKRH